MIQYMGEGVISIMIYGLNGFKRKEANPWIISLHQFFSFATRPGSLEWHIGPYYLTHPVNFLFGRKLEYLEKTHDFRQSVTYTKTFHMRTKFESH